jgi:ProP effector
MPDTPEAPVTPPASSASDVPAATTPTADVVEGTARETHPLLAVQPAAATDAVAAAGAGEPPSDAPTAGMPVADEAVVASGPEGQASESGSVPEPKPQPQVFAPARADLPPAEVAARLAEHFPALFGAGIVKPIKLRIQADIQQRLPGLLTRKALSVFLHRHTTSTAYLKALASAETRFDLDGAPAGELAAEHREAAAAELARRREIVLARRAAEREAHRARAPRPARGAPSDAGAPTGRGGEAAHGTGSQPPTAGARAADHRDVRAGDVRRPPQRPAGGPADRRRDRPPAPRDAGRDGRDGRDGRGMAPRGDRPPRPAEPRRDDRARAPRPEREPVPTAAALPADEGQRARALLLRAWEASPLTKANFCALKRLGEAEFDAQIAQALAERAARR